MSQDPEWLPPLLLLCSFDGKWQEYCEKVYAQFKSDFVDSQPQYDSEWVRCRRDPLYEGKEAGFWHCVQQGPDEAQRVPDTRRCERIGWVRAIIENVKDPLVETWEMTRASDRRCVLWFREEYLIVLGCRESRSGTKYKQLITAYCTDYAHTKRKLRRECTEFHKP